MVRLMKLVALAALGLMVVGCIGADNFIPQSPSGDGISIIPNVADYFSIANILKGLVT